MNNDKDYYTSILDDNNRTIKLRKVPLLNNNQNNHPYFQLKHTLDAVMSNDSDYNISTDYVNLIFHQQINTNPLLVNQRHSDTNLNCAVKIVLDLLKARKQTNNNKSRINQVMRINETYYKSGINNEGLQLLSNKSQMHLIVKDKLKHIWHEFKPQSKGFHQKVLMFAHNNHLENLSDPEPYDSEDEEEPETSDLIGFPIEDKLKTLNMNQQEIVWFDNTDDLVACALPYEQTNTLGHWILSKSEPVGYIASNGTTLKIRYSDYETYPDCFTNGGVGKVKFLEQHPEFEKGITKTDPFYDLLMDADVSGIYMRQENMEKDTNKQKHVKYDQNKSYKSFYKSNLFNGFPRISAVFNVGKQFSEFEITLEQNNVYGLLYIEYDKLTLSNIKKCHQIYYEGNGWYPIEIVKANYENYGINVFVKQYAYASEVFQVDFSDFKNDQFRTFLGKCISGSYDDKWRTRDYNEFMRARFLLRDRITCITEEDCGKEPPIYSITYKTEKEPWNFPIISVYVKSHQKYNIFSQYNKLMSSGMGIKVLAMSVDSIETNKECDNLFDLGTQEGQWKIEEIKNKNN